MLAIPVTACLRFLTGALLLERALIASDLNDSIKKTGARDSAESFSVMKAEASKCGKM